MFYFYVGINIIFWVNIEEKAKMETHVLLCTIKLEVYKINSNIT